MLRKAALLAASFGLVLVAPVAVAAGSGNSSSNGSNPSNPLAELPAAQAPVMLTINPDGTAVWNGEPLAGVPQLRDRLAHRTQQDPKLELDLHFHNVGQLSDSNRQTLLDVLELAAKYGYVHVQATGDGAKLTVLGPTAVDNAPK